jgi:hypothetical protein
MRHIHIKDLLPYTIVIAEEPLEKHITIITNPKVFEILDTEIPKEVQYLDYEISDDKV